jgi:hypothetical protein
MTKKIYTMMFLVLLAAASLPAQTWTANATTAVPNFSPTGLVKTTTFDGGVHGKGVTPRPGAEGQGISFLYVPVTAPQGSTFACIGLRADDATALGAIRSEFYRQPRDGNPGPAVLLGAVTTGNAGFQFDQAGFAAQVINYNFFTYYIRIIFSVHPSSTVPPPQGLIAYDVSLSPTCVHSN